MTIKRSRLEVRIYRYMSEHGQVSTDQLYSWMSIDIHTLHDTLRAMRNEGIIASANGTWYLRCGIHAGLS